MRGAVEYCCGGACGCAWMAGELAGWVCLLSASVPRTPRRCFGDSTLLGGSGPKSGLRAHFLACGSRASAKFGRRARLVREKIIGHGVGGLAPRIASGSPLVVSHRGQRALGLLAFRRPHRKRLAFARAAHVPATTKIQSALRGAMRARKRARTRRAQTMRSNPYRGRDFLFGRNESGKGGRAWGENGGRARRGALCRRSAMCCATSC